MKLLLPRERISLGQQEHERLVKTETALSSRVDELRRLGEEESKKLQDFQEREFRKYEEETESRKSALASLDAEIAERQQERARYFESNPIDKQWLLYVKAEKQKLDEGNASISSEKSFLGVAHQALEKEERALEEKRLRIEQGRAEALTLIDDARERVRQAGKTLESARLEAKSMVDSTEESRKAARSLEEEGKVKMSELTIREDALDRLEKELEERETAVLVKELIYYSPIKK